MTSPKLAKEAIRKSLLASLSSTRNFLFLDFEGVNVQEMEILRRRLKEKEAHLQIIKNRITQLALHELGYTGNLRGPNALILAKEDTFFPVLKILLGFRKEFQKLKLKIGYLEGKMVETQDLERLATLPPVKELQTQLVTTLESPLKRLHFSLKSNLYRILFVLNKRKESF